MSVAYKYHKSGALWLIRQPLVEGSLEYEYLVSYGSSDAHIRDPSKTTCPAKYKGLGYVTLGYKYLSFDGSSLSLV
jgi:hypothetical protein